MSEKTAIKLENALLTVVVDRSTRRRRTIAFVMESPSVLKVTAPVRASFSSIQTVIQKHKGWIKRRLDEFRKRADLQPLNEPKTYRDGATVAYLGHTCTLCITHDKTMPQGCRLLPHRLVVNLHNSSDAKDLQEEVRLEVLLWLKKRARALFQRRTKFWSGRLGVRYGNLTITNAGRRWGSCNAKNDIRLNWRLAMAPLDILDYVVVHELCHVRHKNHGPRFWGQVASVMPDYKYKRKHLRFIGNRLVL